LEQEDPSMLRYRNIRTAPTLKALGAGTFAALLCASCATTPEPASEAPPPAPAPSPTPSPPPPAPKPPRVPTAEERQRAEQLAGEAVVLLQTGDAVPARQKLDQALALDSNNDLAKLMMRQMTADPVAELGATHFSYTIQRDDTLAKLAQRFLNDRYLFYLLARYNDIAQPNVVHVGQVIKIPGKAPPKPVEPAPTPPSTPPAEDANARRLAEARAMENRGDAEGALAAYMDVLRRDPANAEAKVRSADLRKRLVDRYSAEAAAAFARQDLDKTIEAWDRVLQVDPGNQTAKLKRQQAIDLKERLKRFDSPK
jgi:tetratricopeptide (TPR) repeat protein